VAVLCSTLRAWDALVIVGVGGAGGRVAASAVAWRFFNEFTGA